VCVVLTIPGIRLTLLQTVDKEDPTFLKPKSHTAEKEPEPTAGRPTSTSAIPTPSDKREEYAGVRNPVMSGEINVGDEAATITKPLETMSDAAAEGSHSA